MSDKSRPIYQARRELEVRVEDIRGDLFSYFISRDYVKFLISYVKLRTLERALETLELYDLGEEEVDLDDRS